MLKKSYLASLFFYQFSCFVSVISQGYTFNVSVGNLPLEKNILAVFQEDSIRVSTLKFYVSNIKCIDNEGSILWQNNHNNLIDVFGKNTLEIPQNIIENTQVLNFDIGVDTAVNNMPPMEGDLSAKNGMFWSWTSGYMAFKLEGSHSLSPEKKNQFVLHLGNDNLLSRITSVVQTNGKNRLCIDLSPVFLHHSFASNPNVMDVNESTIMLLELISKSIVSK